MKLKKNNLIVGCIYRHHCEPEVFVNGFLKLILNDMGKTKKNCATLILIYQNMNLKRVVEISMIPSPLSVSGH